jgi:hypothetical protein
VNIITINFVYVYCKQLDARDEINRKAKRARANENSNIITSINDTLCQLSIVKIHLFFSFLLFKHDQFSARMDWWDKKKYMMGQLCVDYFIIITPYKDDNWFRLYNWFVIKRKIFLNTHLLSHNNDNRPKGNRNYSRKILSRTITKRRCMEGI